MGPPGTATDPAITIAASTPRMGRLMASDVTARATCTGAERVRRSPTRTVGDAGARPWSAYPVTVNETGRSHVGAVEDPLVRDDRLRLFSFATAEKRTHYLWVLRAFDHARGNYTVLLHAGDVETVLNRIAADGSGDVPEASDLPALLEQLHAWGVLERSYDAPAPRPSPSTATATTSTSSGRQATGRSARSRMCSRRAGRMCPCRGWPWPICSLISPNSPTRTPPGW